MGLLSAAGLALSVESGSAQFRLVGATPASTAGRSTSATNRLDLVGGNGQAIGLSASPTVSVNSGGASLQLPTNRIFRNGMEN